MGCSERKDEVTWDPGFLLRTPQIHFRNSHLGDDAPESRVETGRR